MFFKGMRTRSIYSLPKTEARIAPILWWKLSRLSTRVSLMFPARTSGSSALPTQVPAYPPPIITTCGGGMCDSYFLQSDFEMHCRKPCAANQ